MITVFNLSLKLSLMVSLSLVMMHEGVILACNNTSSIRRKIRILWPFMVPCTDWGLLTELTTKTISAYWLSLQLRPYQPNRPHVWVNYAHYPKSTIFFIWLCFLVRSDFYDLTLYVVYNLTFSLVYSVHTVMIGLFFNLFYTPVQSDNRTFIWYCFHRLHLWHARYFHEGS